MTGSMPVADHAPDVASDQEASTRRRILQLVAADGPVSAADLAAALDLAAAGVRRHLQALEQSEQIVVHIGPAGSRGRGRPARRYVVTAQGQAALTQRYAEIATDALHFLADAAGPRAVRQFAEHRVAELEARHGDVVDAAGDDVAARAQALARALAEDGYAASARPVPGTAVVQLCQGHCPVQDVAAQFPELCEAETRAFSRMLGVHVQRLSTLGSGGHVCTTSIPAAPGRSASPDVGDAPAHPARPPDGRHARPPTPQPSPAPVHSTEGPTP